MQKNTDKEKEKGEGHPQHPWPNWADPRPSPPLPLAPPSLFPRPGSEQGQSPPHHLAGDGEDKGASTPASSGLSPTRPRSPLGLCASLFPPDPRRSFLPHARRGRRRSPSFPRPPCPNRHFAVSYAVAALDYITSTSPLKLGATATTSPSSSSSHGRRRSPPRFAAASLPRAHSRTPAGSM